jgi:hypothetical protein
MSSEMIRGGALKNTFAALKNSSIASRKVLVFLIHSIYIIYYIYLIYRARNPIGSIKKAW